MPEPSPFVDEVAHRTIGAAIEVHRTLGPGYVEQAYQRALQIELRLRGVAFESQVPFALSYKDESLETTFRLDLVVEGVLLVELKAVDVIGTAHLAQVISYLKASGLGLGLIINFHAALLRDGLKRVLPPPRVLQRGPLLDEKS